MKKRSEPLAVSIVLVRPGEISPIEFKTLIHQQKPFHVVIIEQNDVPSFIIADMENQRSGARIHKLPCLGSVGQENNNPQIPVRDFYPEVVSDIFQKILEDLLYTPNTFHKLIRILVVADVTIWKVHSDLFSRRASSPDLQIVSLPGDAYQITGFIPVDEDALVVRVIGQIPENSYKKMQAA